MKLECEKLTDTIMKCFDNSMDNCFTPKERKEFLIQGKRLRGSLVNLLSAEFSEGTVEVKDANKKIHEINTTLKEKNKAFADIVAVTDDLAKLFSILDDLLIPTAGYV